MPFGIRSDSFPVYSVPTVCVRSQRGPAGWWEVSVAAPERARSPLCNQGRCNNGVLSTSRCVISSSRQMARWLTFADQPSIPSSPVALFPPPTVPASPFSAVRAAIYRERTEVFLLTWQIKPRDLNYWKQSFSFHHLLVVNVLCFVLKVLPI